MQVLIDIHIMVQNGDEDIFVDNTESRRRRELVKEDYREDAYRLVRAIRAWRCTRGPEKVRVF